MHETPKPQKVRIVVCRGQYCNMGRRADAIFRQLEAAIAPFRDAHPELHIKLEIANCLSMCGVGPNVVIYPDAVTGNDLTPNRAALLVQDYLMNLVRP